jgi:hypothetical protein
MDAGALFGVVAALTVVAVVVGLFALGWLLKPRPPGPRILAPLGALPMLPMVFVLAGWLLGLSARDALLAALAVFVPMALLAVLRHPGQ